MTAVQPAMTLVSRSVTPLLIAYATTSGDVTWATTAIAIPSEGLVPVAPERPELAQDDAQRGSGLVSHRDYPTGSSASACRYSGSREQLVVRSVRDDAAAVEEDDAVGQADRLDTVRDHERGAAAHRFDEAAPDRGLGRRVDGAHRVVEDQHARVAQDRTGDREPLPLAAGQRVALRSDDGLVPVGQRAHERVRFGKARGPLDLGVGRLGPPDAEVVANARREHDGVLEHDRHRAAQLVEAQLVDGGTVEEDATRGRVVEATRQERERRLAGSARADERDRGTAVDDEVEVGEQRPRRQVAETDTVEADRSRPGRQVRGHAARSVTSGSAASTSAMRADAADACGQLESSSAPAMTGVMSKATYCRNASRSPGVMRPVAPSQPPNPTTTSIALPGPASRAA